MKYSTQLLICAICLVLTLNYTVVQASLPWFGRGGAQAIQSSTSSIEYDIQEYEVEITTSTRRRQKTTTTEAAELARVFDQALVAVNRHKKDIHVGKLLSACEELAGAIRRIGFGQSANDILNNVQKIRKVYNKFPNKSQRDSITSILQYELDSGMIQQTTKSGGLGLSENSAAIGFVWLARIINYQYDMFSLMINNSKVEPYEASVYAYERTLKPHLSWTVRKIVQAALMTLKSMKKETILSRIGGFTFEEFGQQEQQATIKDVKQFLDISKVVLTTCRQAFQELNIGHI